MRSALLFVSRIGFECFGLHCRRNLRKNGADTKSRMEENGKPRFYPYKAKRASQIISEPSIFAEVEHC